MFTLSLYRASLIYRLTYWWARILSSPPLRHGFDMADESGKSALDLLSQLKAIIEEQEQTIKSQAERIRDLEKKNADLRERLDGDDAQNLSRTESCKSRDNEKKPHNSNDVYSPLASENGHHGGDEHVSSIAKRSSSFQRKHLEEQDARKRTNAYELSSDLLDRQIEVIRNLYGGADKCERAARIIQEAYRSHRMRINFSKIRKSKTRRLTLENKLHVSDSKADEGSKVEVVELVLDQSTKQESENEMSTEVEHDTPPDSADESRTPVREENFDHLFNEQSFIAKEPDGGEPQNSVDSSENAAAKQEQEMAQMLADISMPGIMNNSETVKRRKNRKNRGHGYETIVLPQKSGDHVNNGPKAVDVPDGKKVDDETQSLRRSIATSSMRSRNSGSGTPPPHTNSMAWQRVGSELSLTSYDNEADEESLRSSDTASIASGQSELSNSVAIESYQRRSTLSARGSWHIDSTNDVMRKRLYRIGLNLFNRKPEKGIEFLVEHSFISRTAPAIATFLLNRKGLSRQMVGEYLGNTQKRFNQDVLDSVCELMDFSGLDIDEALRNFQCQVKVQGEAQKVDRLVEAFSQRYCTCNPKLAESLKDPDAIFILAFAIIMLNTDLHSPNMKREKRMSEDDFVRNLRGVDGGDDLDDRMLRNVYHRIHEEELKTDDDHVTQVLNVEKSIVGKKPVLAVPHRRLVCYCRLYQVTDPAKPQKIGLHHRAVFLFNDLLLITKLIQRKKNNATYGYKLSLPLQGMNVLLFETTYYLYGIRLINSMDNKVLVTFNAPNEHDRNKFVTDLRESINEVQQMENYRIGAELEKAESRTNSLSRENKLLSASMHNLSEMPAHGMPPLAGGERPASMYTLEQLGANKNNNNTKHNDFLSPPHNHHSKSSLNNSLQSQKSDGILSSLFKVGKKGGMSPQGAPKETYTNSNSPQITLTLSEV